jgi:hypothetical protein
MYHRYIVIVNTDGIQYAKSFDSSYDALTVANDWLGILGINAFFDTTDIPMISSGQCRLGNDTKFVLIMTEDN